MYINIVHIYIVEEYWLIFDDDNGIERAFMVEIKAYKIKENSNQNSAAEE
jgi:hypothetical protein